MDVDENAGLFEGYQLKLNSYDLGVDIELSDALQRLRFEHPGVKVVIFKSAKDKVFCAGANIRMLAGSAHSHKVNFCKFTNETRNGMEDSSRALRPEVPVRGEGHGGRRRLRAGAVVRQDHPRRRRQLDRVAAGDPAAGRAARHRRPHPRHRQAQGAPRPRRRVLHHRGRHQGQARCRLAPRRCVGAKLEVRCRRRRDGEGDGGDFRPSRATPRASS